VLKVALVRSIAERFVLRKAAAAHRHHLAALQVVLVPLRIYYNNLAFNLEGAVVVHGKFGFHAVFCKIKVKRKRGNHRPLTGFDLRASGLDPKIVFLLRACLNFGFAGENGKSKVLTKQFLSLVAVLRRREKCEDRFLLWPFAAQKPKFKHALTPFQSPPGFALKELEGTSERISS
jgi:hypothetical protein